MTHRLYRLYILLWVIVWSYCGYRATTTIWPVDWPLSIFTGYAFAIAMLETLIRQLRYLERMR